VHVNIDWVYISKAFWLSGLIIAERDYCVRTVEDVCCVDKDIVVCVKRYILAVRSHREYLRSAN